MLIKTLCCLLLDRVAYLPSEGINKHRQEEQKPHSDIAGLIPRQFHRSYPRTAGSGMRRLMKKLLPPVLLLLLMLVHAFWLILGKFVNRVEVSIFSSRAECCVLRSMEGAKQNREHDPLTKSHLTKNINDCS